MAARCLESIKAGLERLQAIVMDLLGSLRAVRILSGQAPILETIGEYLIAFLKCGLVLG